MTKLISRTAALSAARRDVTTLTYAGPGAGYDTYQFSTYSHGYEAWVASRPTWYAQARAHRSASLAGAAVQAMLNEAGLPRAHYIASNAEEAVVNGASVAEAVDAAREIIAAETADAED